MFGVCVFGLWLQLYRNRLAFPLPLFLPQGAASSSETLVLTLLGLCHLSHRYCLLSAVIWVRQDRWEGRCVLSRAGGPPHPPAWKFYLRKGRRHRLQPWEPAGLARTTQSAAQLVRPGQGWGRTRGRARPAGEAPSCAPWETNAECLPCAPTAPWKGGRSPPPFQMGARSPLTRTRRGQAGVRA